MRTSLADVRCSIARTMEIVSDGWTALILRDVFCGIQRFDQLREDLGVSRNVLTARLDTLVEAGVLERRRYSERPPRDEYVPTAKGDELYPVILALMAWGDKWVHDGEPPAQIHHTRCNRVATPTVVCDCCREPLTAADAVAEAGPSGTRGRGTQLLGVVLRQRADARAAPSSGC